MTVLSRGVPGHRTGPGERRDQHGHGLGQGVNHILVYTYDTCFRLIFQGKPEFHYFGNIYSHPEGPGVLTE